MYEAGDHVGGHTNTIRVDTEDATWDVDTGFIVLNDRNYPRFEALLDELGVARQPANMSFSVSAEAEDFEYSSHGVARPARPALEPRPPALRCGWWPTTCASTARRARCWPTPATSARCAPSSTTSASRRGSSTVCSCPRPPPSGRPTPSRCGRSRRASSSQFFDHHGMLSLHRPAALATIDGRLGALRGGAHRPLRRSHPRPHAGAAVTRHPTHVDVVAEGERAEEFDEVVVAAHADQALALLTDPSAGRGRGARRLRLPAQRGRPAHRPLAAPAPARGVGGVELSPARPSHAAAAP